MFGGESPTADEEYVQRLGQSKFADACEAGFVRYCHHQATTLCARPLSREVESRPIMLPSVDIQQKTFEDADDEYKPRPDVP